MNKTKTIVISSIVAAFLLLAFAVGAFLVIRGYFVPANLIASPANSSATSSPTPASGENPFLPKEDSATDQPVNASSSVNVGILQIILRLVIAVILSAVLA